MKWLALVLVLCVVACTKEIKTTEVQTVYIHDTIQTRQTLTFARRDTVHGHTVLSDTGTTYIKHDTIITTQKDTVYLIDTIYISPFRTPDGTDSAYIEVIQNSNGSSINYIQYAGEVFIPDSVNHYVKIPSPNVANLIVGVSWETQTHTTVALDNFYHNYQEVFTFSYSYTNNPLSLVEARFPYIEINKILSITLTDY